MKDEKPSEEPKCDKCKWRYGTNRDKCITCINDVKLVSYEREEQKRGTYTISCS